LLAEINDGNLSTKTKRAEQSKLKVKTLDKLRKQKEAKERNRLYRQNKDILDKLKSVEEKKDLMINLKKCNQKLVTLTKTHKDLIFKINKIK
jgi:hypothetical protein